MSSCDFRFLAICLSAFVCSAAALNAQDAIYDESLIPEFTLPDPFTTTSGEVVEDADAWINQRRGEILDLFAAEVYGSAPPAPEAVRSELISYHANALGGKAIREEVDLLLGDEDAPLVARMLIYRPQTEEKVPAFLALNFGGNHSIHPDPEITLNKNWMRNKPDSGYENHQATEASRGASASRWPVEKIIERGYALVTIYYGDFDPDFDDGFENGLHGQYPRSGESISPKDWGSIAAWAWGLSRALDYLQESTTIDGERVAVLGHSRLGKTSLWAGASDPRFALVISNNSGCGGAALSRRRFGESVRRINKSFPHWFCDNFLKYDDNEDELPVDQHLLVAAIAPRPVYIASAVEDQWADPHGEFLSALHADPVYRLLGTDGFGGDAPPAEMPEVDQPINSGTIGYHIRSGKHDVTDYDWEQYLDFADRHLKSTAE
ncbi:acetylxylan esterase [Thalassoglobus sp. JC818]|uniref:alpha/beta hydrolase family protein n=1 Tax=Thalassoglobus sp. JC818 TaxID=3232136 RepID=UPI003457CE7A